MITELTNKDEETFIICQYGNCTGQSTHEWHTYDGEAIYICGNHANAEFVESIINQVDHIPTLQDLLTRAINE